MESAEPFMVQTGVSLTRLYHLAAAREPVMGKSARVLRSTGGPEDSGPVASPSTPVFRDTRCSSSRCVFRYSGAPEYTRARPGSSIHRVCTGVPDHSLGVGVPEYRRSGRGYSGVPEVLLLRSGLRGSHVGRYSGVQGHQSSGAPEDSTWFPSAALHIGPDLSCARLV